MKKQKLFMTLILVIVGVAFFSTNHVYAEGEYINVGDENIYVASGTKSNEAGTVTYNSANSTLTLNNYNGDAIKIDLIDKTAKINVILKGKNSISTTSGNGLESQSDMILTGDGELKINIETDNSICIMAYYALNIKSGNYDLNCKVRSIDGGDTVIDGGSFSGGEINGSQLTINNGTFDISSLRTWDLAIEGGKFKLDKIFAGDMTINDGDIKITDSIEVDWTLIINGGNLSITVGEKGLWASMVSQKITINGGKILIDTPGTSICAYEQLVFNGGVLDVVGGSTKSDWTAVIGGKIFVNGGQINIDSYNTYGLYSPDGITFNGGTTKIVIKRDGEDSSAIISGDGITIGPKMTIVEDGITFKPHMQSGDKTYYASYNANSSVAKKITIQRISEEPEEETKEPDMKVPDTGYMNTTGQTFAVVATALSIPITLASAYILSKLIQRRKNHVKFG